jgi:hypothetical protein
LVQMSSSKSARYKIIRLTLEHLLSARDPEVEDS